MPGRATGRKVKDATEAEALLAKWSSSGEAMSRWCEQRGINWYSLSAYVGWQVRGGRRDDGLVEVVTTTTVSTVGRSGARYRVVLGERTVEVGGDFDDETLRRLLRVVASC